MTTNLIPEHIKTWASPSPFKMSMKLRKGNIGEPEHVYSYSDDADANNDTDAAMIKMRTMTATIMTAVLVKMDFRVTECKT